MNAYDASGSRVLGDGGIGTGWDDVGCAPGGDVQPPPNPGTTRKNPSRQNDRKDSLTQEGSGKMPRRMSRRSLGVVWATRRDLTGCYVTVNRDDSDKIDVVIPGDHGNFYAHPLGRHEARLLARRINQCLDATVIH